MRKLTFVAVVGVLAGAAGVFGPALSRGAPLPDFQLYTTRGKLFTLSEHRGKIVLLDFWASWCPPCRAAMPAMQRLHDEYKGRGVIVMGVNINDNQDPGTYMHDHGFTYPTLVLGGEVAMDYGVKSIPTLIVIDPAGRTVYREAGWSSRHESELREAIDAQLAKIGR